MTRKIHGYTCTGITNSNDEKYILTYEFLMELPEDVWLPNDYEKQLAALITLPDFPGSVFDVYGLDSDEFDNMLSYADKEFTRIVNSNLDALNTELRNRCANFKVIEVAITSIKSVLVADEEDID